MGEFGLWRFGKNDAAHSQKYGHLVFGVVQSGLTSAIAAGVASIPFLGTFAFVENWRGSWLIAWTTTVPFVLLFALYSAPRFFFDDRIRRFAAREYDSSPAGATGWR